MREYDRWLGWSGWVIPSAQATDGFLLGLQGVEFRNASLSLLYVLHIPIGGGHRIPFLFGKRKVGNASQSHRRPFIIMAAERLFMRKSRPNTRFWASTRNSKNAVMGFWKHSFFHFGWEIGRRGQQRNLTPWNFQLPQQKDETKKK